MSRPSLSTRLPHPQHASARRRQEPMRERHGTMGYFLDSNRCQREGKNSGQRRCPQGFRRLLFLCWKRPFLRLLPQLMRCGPWRPMRCGCWGLLRLLISRGGSRRLPGAWSTCRLLLRRLWSGPGRTPSKRSRGPRRRRNGGRAGRTQPQAQQFRARLFQRQPFLGRPVSWMMGIGTRRSSFGRGCGSGSSKPGAGSPSPRTSSPTQG